MSKDIRWLDTGRRKHAFVGRESTSLCERVAIDRDLLRADYEKSDVERCQVCLDVLEKALDQSRSSTERSNDG